MPPFCFSPGGCIHFDEQYTHLSSIKCIQDVENLECYCVIFIYQWDLSFSFICVIFSEACPLGNGFIFGCLAGPLLTVGLHCAIVCANAACVACADPLTVW